LIKSEAEALVIKMKQLWGNPFKVTSQTAFEWAQHSNNIEYKDMDRAIDSFAEQGDKFPPSLAEVVSRASTYKTRDLYDPRSKVCYDCGGPTRSGFAHYSFCKPYGRGDKQIESLDEVVNKPSYKERELSG
jgi:hypothetical protein